MSTPTSLCDLACYFNKHLIISDAWIVSNELCVVVIWTHWSSCAINHIFWIVTSLNPNNVFVCVALWPSMTSPYPHDLLVTPSSLVFNLFTNAVTLLTYSLTLWGKGAYSLMPYLMKKYQLFYWWYINWWLSFLTKDGFIQWCRLVLLKPLQGFMHIQHMISYR